jgi:hypothetical protein
MEASSEKSQSPECAKSTIDLILYNENHRNFPAIAVTEFPWIVDFLRISKPVAVSFFAAILPV